MSRMNILSNTAEVLAAMAQVENDPLWLIHSLKGHPEGLGCAIRSIITKESALAAFLIDDDGEEYPHGLVCIDETVVYGSHGHNRWLVRLNGDVEFSGFHASAEDRVMAAGLGFHVTP